MKLRAILPLLAIAAVLGVIFYAVSRPKDEAPVEPRPYVWDFDMDNLLRISIALPKTDQSEAWVKHDDRYFYFDEANGPKVDMARWGGGIPLILSGPGAERRIFPDATDAKIAELGFNTPTVKITLTLNDQTIYNIEVADATPSGIAYYIRHAGSRDIYTVDSSWYDVVAGLVTNPPFQPATIVADAITVTPETVPVNQPVSIQVQAVNNGTLAGSFDIPLKINGQVVETKSVTLNRDERQTVTFIVTESKSGTYSVSAAGQTGKFTVR